MCGMSPGTVNLANREGVVRRHDSFRRGVHGGTITQNDQDSGAITHDDEDSTNIIVPGQRCAVVPGEHRVFATGES